MFGPPLHVKRTFNISEANLTNWQVRGDEEIASKVIFLLLVGIPSIVANTAILFLIIRHKSLHNSMYLCIANVCIADLLLSLYSPWTFVTNHVHRFFIMGDFICHFNPFFNITCMMVSCLSIVFISFERMMAVLYPFSKRQLRMNGVAWVLTTIWLVSITVAAPLFYWWTYFEDTNNGVLEIACSQSVALKANHYHTIIIILMVFVPCIITSIAFTIIICQLRKYDRKLLNRVHCLKLRNRNKVIRMFFMVLLVDFVCWFPFQLDHMYVAFRPNQGSRFPSWYRENLTYLSYWFIFLHCAINPFIYGIANDNIRKALYKSFPFLPRKKTKIAPETYPPQTSQYHFEPRNSAGSAIWSINPRASRDIT